MPNQEKYDVALMLFNRHNPIIITEIDKIENRTLLEDNLKRLGDFIRLESIATPLGLYNFLSKHRTDLIVVEVDFVRLRKNYLDILQGAICSSPDSGALWKVEYKNEPSFKFKGKIILISNSTKAVIKTNAKYKYISRDCQFI